MLLAVVGVLLIVVGLIDVFLTVLNYDGFSFIAGRVYRAGWAAARFVTRPLPARARSAVLSIAAPAMLPLTVAIWISLEIVGFALVYQPAMDAGWLSEQADREPTFAQALYFSGATIATLGYGDITPGTNLMQAVAVLEALIGFAILTLTISYVLGTFRVIERLRTMADTLRHLIEDHRRPEELIATLVSQGDSSLTPLLTRLHDDLVAYDEGLRIYPIVYYFHSRNPRRSSPFVFGVIGRLVGAMRFGVPRDHPLTSYPWVRALEAEYDEVSERILHSFLRRELPDTTHPASDPAAAGADTGRFDELDAVMRACGPDDADAGESPSDRSKRLQEWAEFERRRELFVDLLDDHLGHSVGADGR